VATIPLRAEQLAEDLQEEYVDAWDLDRCLLIATACELLLDRVNWEQLASRLIEHSVGAPKPIIVAVGDGPEKSQAG
jgi:hypothetical protein